MHKLNILISGPESLILTLNEIKPFLKFNLIKHKRNFNNLGNKNIDGYLSYDISDKKINKEHEKNINSFKILVTNKNKINFGNYDNVLKLPTTISELNEVIEISYAKKKFQKNSSINIKDYHLDKNQKKIIKEQEFIILTEKEIQLLELFLKNKKPISKEKILSMVWKYSEDADTHTVETHIYRLRKKMNEKFSDDKFILNNKDGYYL